MAVTLTLGGVVFQGFEIPETINSGGDQMLAIHKMPGGNRTIDAMGPDDSEIRWSGQFRGSSAETRALLLDLMRRQGQQQLLSYSLHRYQVVVSRFEADFQYGGLEIPYTIACAVVLDETQALASLAVGFVEALASDVVSALGLSGAISSSTINTAVTGVATAASNYQAGVPNTTNAIAGVTAASEGPLLNSLQSSIAGAQSATQAGIVSTTAGINTTPVVAGGSPTTMAASLTNTASGFSQLSSLTQLSSVLGRMATNTSNAGH
jgi:hypothetical protein